MKWLIVVGLIAGCATRTGASSSSGARVVVNHPDAIAQSIGAISIPEDVIGSDRSVSLIDLEGDPDRHPASALVADHLLTHLHQEGMSVYETDVDVLQVLSGEIIDEVTDSGAVSPEDVMPLCCHHRCELPPAEDLGAARRADLMIMYRIVTSGVQLVRFDDSNDIKRVAQTELWVRVVDTQSGDIQWAGSIEGRWSDILSYKELRSLGKTALYPVLHQNPSRE